MINRSQNIFLAGIGGIGVSGLARLLRGEGKAVSGSDIQETELTESLRKEGIPVETGKNPVLPENTDLVIYSVAVPESDPIRAKAREKNIMEMSFPQAVGEYLKNYEKVIAVAGTNGKTTTAAMTAWILQEAGLDPTALIGSIVSQWKSNARSGGRKYFVVEADEYRRAFLNYKPDIAIITNIKVDHLDYFKDESDYISAFREFAGKIKPGGTVIQNIRPKENYKLKIPGRHNQENAALAAAAASALGVDERTIKSALESFTGAWRRFERVGRLGRAEIISDYAHHPDGIRAVLETAAEFYKGKRVLAVFQPHQHNRTKMLFNDFVKEFCGSKIDDFIFAEIFDVAGREEDQDQNVSSEALAGKVRECGKNAAYAADLEDCERMIRKTAGDYDMILIAGAGDIYKVANKLVISYN